MKLNNYLDYTLHCVKENAKSFKEIAVRHAKEPDVNANCLKFAEWSNKHFLILEMLKVEFGKAESTEPERIHQPLIMLRTNPIGLMRDLHDLWLMTSEVKLCWIILIQCAKSLRSNTLKNTCEECCKETERENEWLLSKIKTSASQVLTVPA